MPFYNQKTQFLYRQVYAAGGARLVDRAIAGGKALLLITGTSGSGRSHTIWGDDSAASTGAAAATGTEDQGLLPMALADLSRRWSCGNGSPFYHSSSSAAAAAVTAGTMPVLTPSPTPAESYSHSSLASPVAFRLCVAEVLPGERGTSNNKAGTTTFPATRDLLRGPSSVSRPSIGGGNGDLGEEKVRASPPSPPRRWAMSARGALAGLTSFSSAARPCSSLEPSGRRSSRGGGPKGRAWKGMGRGRGGVAAEGSLLTSQVLAGVHEASAEGIQEALAFIRMVRRSQLCILCWLGRGYLHFSSIFQNAPELSRTQYATLTFWTVFTLSLTHP